MLFRLIPTPSVSCDRHHGDARASPTLPRMTATGDPLLRVADRDARRSRKALVADARGLSFDPPGPRIYVFDSRLRNSIAAAGDGEGGGGPRPPPGLFSAAGGGWMFDLVRKHRARAGLAAIALLAGTLSLGLGIASAHNNTTRAVAPLPCEMGGTGCSSIGYTR